MRRIKSLLNSFLETFNNVYIYREREKEKKAIKF